MSENEKGPDYEAWNEWIDHWRFSNQTSFRVAAELEQVTYAWLWTMRDEIDFTPSKGESVIFVRNRLLPELNLHEDDVLQFTQSTYLAQLFAAKDEEKKELIHSKLDQSYQGFEKWLENKENLDLWLLYTEYLKNPDRQLHEHELDIDLLESPEKWEHLGPADRPKLFGSLYLAFSLFDHKGFLADNLNEWHMTADSSYSAKGSFGYCLHTKNRKSGLPDIIEAWSFENQTTPNVILKPRDDEQFESRQNPLVKFAGRDVKNDKELQKLGLELFTELFSVFNERTGTGLNEEIFHYVVPVYGWSRPTVSPKDASFGSCLHAGALLGWAFYRWKNRRPKYWPDSHKKEPLKLRKALENLAFVMSDFSKDYLSGETEWALERPFGTNDSSVDFMIRNFYHPCGWKCNEISLINQKKYVDFKKDKRCFVNLTRQIPRSSGPLKGQALVAKLEPTNLCVIPDDKTVLDNYLTSLAEHTRFFYKRCVTIEQHAKLGRKVGEQSGNLRSAHDYSKDLNLLDSHLAGFSEDFLKLRKKVEGLNCSSVEEFREDTGKLLKKLLVPEERWLLEARFMMAHQRALTEGRLYEQPEWCLNLIKRGTRGALYKLIKLLVWLPVTWKEHHDLASLKSSNEFTDVEESELGQEGLADWARLFAYDERGRHPEVDKILGEYLRHLFCVEQVTEEEFWNLHPPPQLNQGTPMRETLLWLGVHHEDHNAWRPIGTLCPLLVFSLRAAFQHAWLNVFLQAACHWKDKGKIRRTFKAMTPSVTLTSIDEGTGFILTFPNPQKAIDDASKRAMADELPWGNWHREISRYTTRGLCHPWTIGLEPNHNPDTFQIKITPHYQKI